MTLHVGLTLRDETPDVDTKTSRNVWCYCYMQASTSARNRHRQGRLLLGC